MSPMAPRRAQPDRAETSDIAALAGCAFLGTTGKSGVPAIVPTVGRLVPCALCARAPLLWRRLVLFLLDVAPPTRLGIERSMQVVRAPGHLCETGIVTLHEARQERVACLHVRDTGQPQFLHQAVLQRPVGTLDARLGLARVRAQDLDVELIHGRTELCHP